MLPLIARTIAVAGAVLALSLSAAEAEMVKFSAPLSGASEVPAVQTAGKGDAALTYDTATKMLGWTVNYSGLSSDATAAHLHGPAAAGANAGVVVNLGGASMQSPLKGSMALTDAQAADLMAGKWYVNVHTKTNGGGELRGQVEKAKM